MTLGQIKPFFTNSYLCANALIFCSLFSSVPGNKLISYTTIEELFIFLKIVQVLIKFGDGNIKKRSITFKLIVLKIGDWSLFTLVVILIPGLTTSLI